MKHIVAIDGLRAVAIGAVIAFHLGWPGAALGWAGVPLFFVISGFLITSILIEKKQQAKDFRGFYGDFVRRRVLRIFPLYYAYLACSTLLATAQGHPLLQGWSYWVFLQNYTLGTSQFGASFTMGHTWSLAVEEQFYLLWPLIVWLCRRRTLIAVCALLITLGPISRGVIMKATGNPYLAFTTLPSSVDLLAMGALLGIAYRERLLPTKTLCYLGIALSAAVILLIVPYASYWRPPLWMPTSLGPFVFSALGVGAASFIGLVLNGGYLAKLAQNRIAAYVGKISYGLYIYHGLFLVEIGFLMERARVQGILLGAIEKVSWSVLVIGFSLAAAHLSFNFFEKRFLSLKIIKESPENANVVDAPRREGTRVPKW